MKSWNEKREDMQECEMRVEIETPLPDTSFYSVKYPYALGRSVRQTLLMTNYLSEALDMQQHWEYEIGVVSWVERDYEQF